MKATEDGDCQYLYIKDKTWTVVGLAENEGVLEPETSLRGPVELRDAESGRVIETTLDEASAAEYAERFARFGATVREQCRELGVRYLRMRSDEDVLRLLLAHAEELAVSVA